MSENINREMAKGVGWMVLLRFAERGVGLISTLILVRLLEPTDFGLIAMATSIIAVLELMTAFGFDMALIQNRDAVRHHYDTAWTFNALFGISAALALVAVAPVAAAFYQEPRLELLIPALAGMPLFRGLENIGVVAFRRELEFHREFRFRIIKRLSSFVITVTLAFLWQDYWALIVGMVADAAIGCLLSYLLHPFRPRPSLRGGRDLFGFSVWVLLNSVLAMLRLRVADFMLGRIADARALGFYTVSYEVATLPTTELVMPMNRAVFPAFSKISHDLATLRDSYLKIAAGTLLLTLPAGFGMAAVADLLVPVALGDKWLEAIPIIELLAISGALISFGANTNPVFMAIGRIAVSSMFSALHIALFVGLMLWWAPEEGAVGAARALLTATALTQILPIAYTFKYLSIPVLTYLETVWRPVVGVAAMWFAVRGAVDWLGPLDAYGSAILLLLLLATVALGIVVYGVSVLVLWRWQGRPDGAEQILLHKLLPGLMARFPRVFKRPAP